MRTIVIVVLLSCSCSEPSDSSGSGPGADANAADSIPADGDSEDVGVAAPDVPDAAEVAGEVASGDLDMVRVMVRLDGDPVAGAWVGQGGRAEVLAQTDAQGQAVVWVDRGVAGDRAVFASHPRARARAAILFDDPADNPAEVVVDLESFDDSDNEAYLFQPPGAPGASPNSAYCGHCHQTTTEDWHASAHRSSASNPAVQDVYAGAAAAFASEAACLAVGGAWRQGLVPGTGDVGHRCYVGDGVLSALNPGCADDAAACDGKTTQHGGCAGCHAPGIDGELGGRDLLEATDVAYEAGVHCDVCHRVERVEPEGAPGVAGRLRLVRPSEKSFSPALGQFQPLTFGPSHDSVNVRMGSVQRDHFHSPDLCGGCHEQWQEALVPGTSVDTDRWPSGRFPVHTTRSELEAGPLADVATCQGCHMPPDPRVANAGDRQLYPAAPTGIVSGWLRPPGAVNRHSFVGPRTEGANMLRLAAAVAVDVTVTEEGVTAQVTTSNVGPGHALPTGEPMRSMVLTVEATCGGAPLKAVGGDAVPDFGGFEDVREAGQDWANWSGAAVGDRIHVVSDSGAMHDYVGTGPFGDGTFAAAQKGMPVWRHVGTVEVTQIAGDAITTNEPIPAGDRAYRVSEVGAGAPGFGFARVLVDAQGRSMVPHYRAVDVRSDNRLLPQQSWTSTHEFAACASPGVEAVLWYRRYPVDLAAERGWDAGLIEMTRAVWTPPEAVAVEAPTPTGEVVEVQLTAAPHTVEGASSPGYAYNGSVPGPLIEANVGDTLRVTLANALDDPTTIHWHGVEVPWAMDGATWMQEPVAPGESFTYEFVLRRAGTFWYHPHFDTAGQVDGGLYGALVVRDPDAVDVGRDVVLVFDTPAEHTPGANGPSASASADSVDWWVNGAAQPEVDAGGQSAVRARIVNAANGRYLALRVDGGTVIAGDQGLLAAPETPQLLVLSPGDRAEVVWPAGTDVRDVVAVPYSRHGGLAWNDAEAPWSRERVVFRISGGAAKATAPVDSLPFDGAKPTPDPDHTDVVYVFAGSDRTGRWVINGEAFPDVTVQEVPMGRSVILEVRNLSPTEHPFHLHGHHFEVLSLSGEVPTHRRIEDTVNVPIRGWARLRVDTHNPGEWMAHCHILPHAEEGMMTVLRVGPSAEGTGGSERP